MKKRENKREREGLRKCVRDRWIDRASAKNRNRKSDERRNRKIDTETEIDGGTDSIKCT